MPTVSSWIYSNYFKNIEHWLVHKTQPINKGDNQKVMEIPQWKLVKCVAHDVLSSWPVILSIDILLALLGLARIAETNT